MKKRKQQDVKPAKQYPGLFRRLGAWLYDSLVIAAVLMLAGGVAMAVAALMLYTGLLDLGNYQDLSAYMTQHPVVGMLYTGYLALVIVGFFAYFWCKGGQTLGMRAWKLRLQNKDGSNIRLTQALIRMGSSAFGLGNLIAPFSKEKQSFQDLMAECEMIVLPKVN
ncbi:Putative transmembrane protein [Photobacterium marinum]|uniref:Putative transmembrane protein n=1 Tax=Photobacterium marinum TaxID=1056511 RepID=L8J7I7_9GAMM|nr:RDD family protein [Photobacterium marinum]ELR64736.1 Putative transmembrane protein [Photobacterium marinum]